MSEFGLGKIILAFSGTTLSWLFGAWDTPIKILVAFIILDYILGVLKAVINKEVSSSVGAKGIAKKGIIFIILIVAVLLDRLLNLPSNIFRSLVAYFYIANEGISLIENCVAMGVPVPAKLKDILVQLKEGKKVTIKDVSEESITEGDE